MHALKNWTFIFASFFLLPSSLFAISCHATGPANTGSGSGADWNNVMKLPTAPVRGDTYYLEDGSYGTYTPTTATSGTSRITIKKAQSYDYGRVSDGCTNDISAGWNAGTMGSGQAIFSGTGGTVSTTSGQGYYTLDGNGRTATAGCGVSPAVNTSASDCGIKIMASGTSPTTYGVLWINSTYDAGATRASGWVVRYVELAGAGDAGNTLTNSNEHTFYCRNGCNNLSIEHVYAHDSACDFMDIPYGDGVTINLSHFKQNASSSNCHGQFFLGDGNQMNNFTWSNSLIQDVQGTAYWSVLNGGQASNWDIFNNVIFQTSGSSRPGISTGTVVVINSSSYANNINVIDNTWVNAKTDYSNHFAAYCDATCTGAYQERGSLYYGIIDSQDSVSPSPVAGPGAFTNAQESYNSIINSGTVNYGYGGTGDIKATGQANPFVNWTNYNFSLTGNIANVTASLSLSSPFNVDAAGIPRPSGGVWNRGAFQFFIPQSNNLQPVVQSTPQIITPQYSKNGYPWPVLAGQDMTTYFTPYAEVDKVTAWSANSSSITFTTAGTTLEVGDVIKPRYFYAAGEFFNRQVYIVTGVSGNDVTVSIVNGPSPISGSEASAQIEKYAGPNFSGSGKTEIVLTTACGGSGQPTCETFRLYTQDGSQDTGFQAHPATTTGTVPHVNFTVGPTPGACTVSGTPGSFSVNSTIEFDVKFTLDADPTQVATQHYVVCANGGGSGRTGVVHVSPGYRQAYHNRYFPLQAFVFGNTDKRVDWSIVDAPSGWDGGLVTDSIRDTHHPQVVFYSGTTGSGQVHVKACMHSSATDCGEVTVYISANDPPAQNVDQVEQAPCENDPEANFGTDFEIGPSQAHQHLADFPQSWSGSMLIRIHNEGTAGSPTTYNEYMQINAPSPAGTYTDRNPALLMCGVANPTNGELPVIDAENATGNSWTSQYISAPSSIIGIYGQTGPNFIYNGVNKVFSYVTVSNLKIKNVTTGYSYTAQDGTTKPWGESYNVRPFGLQYFTTIGERAVNDANPFFDDCYTANPGWPGCSQDTFYEGNNAEGYGINGDFLEHPFYLQALRVTSVLNNLRGQKTGAQGTTCYSSRGSSDVRMYNRCVVQSPYQGGYPGGHSEIQDTGIAQADTYLGDLGNTSCNLGSGLALGCLGQFGGYDWYAAEAEEHNNTDMNIGNAYYMSFGGNKYMSLATTHATTDSANSSQGWWGYNTMLINEAQVDGAQFGEILRQTSDNDPTTLALYDVPINWMRLYLQNNIIPWKNNATGSGFSAYFGITTPTLFDFRSNLVAPGQVTITSNMHPVTPVGTYLYPQGFYNVWQYTDPWSPDPLNQDWAHGMTQSDFIAYNEYPVDLTTLYPLSDSNAIGTATTLQGKMADYPPYFNAVDDDMAPFTLRENLSTMGAYDAAAPAFTSKGYVTGIGFISGNGVIR